MRGRRIGVGGISLGVFGTLGILMLIPAGNADQPPQRQAVLSASPALTTFLQNAVDPLQANRPSDEVIADVAAGPDPSRVVEPIAPVAIASLDVASTALPDAPVGDRELVAVRSPVNMRSGPSTSYGSMFVLQPDEQVAVISRQDGWVNIEKTDGTSGWVYGSYLGGGAADVDDTATGSVAAVDPAPRAQPVRSSRAAAAESESGLASVAVRASPSRRSETIFTVAAGTPLRVAERRDGWARVIAPDGVSGWVRTR